MKTTVVNTRVSDFDIYIGRKTATPYHFGNPWHIGAHGTRAEVVEKFDHWIHEVAYTHVEPRRRAWILKNLEKLRGKQLGCYCAPLACHGDIYVKMLQEKEGGEKTIRAMRSLNVNLKHI